MNRDEYSIAADLLEDHGFDAPAKLLRQLGTAKTIFAISGGEYSDYRVDAIVEDEETAKKWAEAMNADPERYSDTKQVEGFTFIPAGTAPRSLRSLGRMGWSGRGRRHDGNQRHP